MLRMVEYTLLGFDPNRDDHVTLLQVIALGTDRVLTCANLVYSRYVSEYNLLYH